MNVTLYCNVSAVRVGFVWERSTDGSSWSRLRHSQRPYYVVRNIQQTEQYRCIAGNNAGTLVSNAAIIEVLGKYIQLCNYTNLHVISDIILEVIAHPQNIQVKSGSSVTLTCTSSISSNVTFSWTHNGTITKQPSSIINGDTSRLTISNVRYSDGGSYVCIVRSGSLSVTSNTAIITICGKLKCMLYLNCYLMLIALV